MDTKYVNRAEGTLRADTFQLGNTAGGTASATYIAQTGRGNIHGITVIPETDTVADMINATVSVNVNGTLIFTRPLLSLWIRAFRENFMWMFAREGSTIRLEVTDASGNTYNVSFVFWYNQLNPEQENAWIEKLNADVIKVS